MTNTALSRRLLKLEANMPQGELEALTDDELKVLLLEVYRAMPDRKAQSLRGEVSSPGCQEQTSIKAEGPGQHLVPQGMLCRRCRV